MRESGSSELLVTDQAQGLLRPFGRVTASDIVMRVLALNLDPAVMTAGDIAGPGPFADDSV